MHYRLLGATGAWKNSGLLSASVTSYFVEGLTNEATYEVRVRASNDDANTDANTHWLGPWSYNTATPTAATGGD